MSIEDLNLETGTKGHSAAKLVTSPRSVEAARRVGIDLKELDPISKDSVIRKL